MKTIILIIALFFSLISSGCVHMQIGDPNPDNYRQLPKKDFETARFIDTLPRGRKLFYKEMDADYKCLIRVIDASEKYYETELFLCIVKHPKYGEAFTVVRFRTIGDPIETAPDMWWATEEEAWRALLPLANTVP